MRKVLIVFIVLFLLISSSCSKKDTYELNYHFVGENQNWVAEYIGHSKGDFYKQKGLLRYKAKSDEKFTLTYKGDLSDISSYKEIEYTFGFIGSRESFDNGIDKKVFVWSSEGNGFGKMNDVEKVTVTLGGKVETFDTRIVK